jgi:hypothetical protein
MSKTTETAKSLRAKLAANVDAFYSYQIDYETFSARNRIIWDEVTAAGRKVNEIVSAMLREGLRVQS